MSEMSKIILNIPVTTYAEARAKLTLYGNQLALDNMRKNDNWDIIWAIPLPEKPGERKCEIVIGNRHTEFQPFVAWHCFDGGSYAWGHYVQTFDDALDCAIDKICMELGIKKGE